MPRLGSGLNFFPQIALQDEGGNCQSNVPTVYMFEREVFGVGREAGGPWTPRIGVIAQDSETPARRRTRPRNTAYMRPPSQ